MIIELSYNDYFVDMVYSAYYDSERLIDWWGKKLNDEEFDKIRNYLSELIKMSFWNNQTSEIYSSPFFKDFLYKEYGINAMVMIHIVSSRSTMYVIDCASDDDYLKLSVIIQ